MNICIVSHHDTQGGAARAAYRLHLSFLDAGIKSRMLVLKKTSDDPKISKVVTKKNTDPSSGDLNYLFSNLIQRDLISANRTDISNTIFSFPYPGIDISRHPFIQEADIVNVHWVSWFLSPTTLSLIDRPIVFTLHDENHFTGGCHYTAACQEFRRTCQRCPQLKNDEFFLPALVLEDKKRAYAKTAHVITPSNWLASQARSSSVFSDIPITTIPNCIDQKVFFPQLNLNKHTLSSIPKSHYVILLGAENGNEIRKGYLYASESLKIVRRLHPDSKNITIVCFGEGHSSLINLGFNVVSLGYINNDTELAEIYSKADLFLLPSIEDNLPNTVLESISCGTPVVGFPIGGIPDLIIEGLNGSLAKDISEHALVSAIMLWLNKGPVTNESRNIISSSISNTTSPERISSLYINIFYKLLNTKLIIEKCDPLSIYNYELGTASNTANIIAKVSLRRLVAGANKNLKYSLDQFSFNELSKEIIYRLNKKVRFLLREFSLSKYKKR